MPVHTQPQHTQPGLSAYASMPPFQVMEILELAARLTSAGKSILHFEVGEPSLPTPAPVVDAAIHALHKSRTHYTHSMGIVPLREALCQMYEKDYQVSLDVDRFAVSSGTSPLLWQMFSLLLQPGDEVILPEPYYPSHRAIPEAIGATVRCVPGDPENGFLPSEDDLLAAISPRTKLFVTGSPANPTGTCFPDHLLVSLAQKIPWLLVDEIYRGIVFDKDDDRSALQNDLPNLIVADGFSKRYAMTGWRLGYLVVPPALRQPLQRMQQNLMISANHFVQEAAMAALTNPQVIQLCRERTTRYHSWRDHLASGLKKLGFRVPFLPEGAFYLMTENPFGGDSLRTARDILERTGVAIAPGVDFGPLADNYLRFSYLQDQSTTDEALHRLARIM